MAFSESILELADVEHVVEVFFGQLDAEAMHGVVVDIADVQFIFDVFLLAVFESLNQRLELSGVGRVPFSEGFDGLYRFVGDLIWCLILDKQGNAKVL